MGSQYLTKDPEKVELGRRGGSKIQESIREITLMIGKLGTELDLESKRCEKLESENKELKMVLTVCAAECVIKVFFFCVYIYLSKHAPRVGFV